MSSTLLEAKDLVKHFSVRRGNFGRVAGRVTGAPAASKPVSTRGAARAGAGLISGRTLLSSATTASVTSPRVLVVDAIPQTPRPKLLVA